MVDLNEQFLKAADAIRSADALLIGAGAGMGVDSGLPDFRGTEGFWKAYPPFRGRQFREMSTPHWFQTDPKLAWGFFGHRMNMYRSAAPHQGFEILHRLATQMRLGYFIFTSNVDGQFQKAGFPESKILECHGSIHHLQCATPCCDQIWSSSGVALEVDDSIRTRSPLPQCPRCRNMARPNILMFGDRNWIVGRAEEQERRYRNWLRGIESARLVTIELGAGLAVPSVRYECETRDGTLIRINPREAETPSGGISVSAGALSALQQIDAILQQ